MCLTAQISGFLKICPFPRYPFLCPVLSALVHHKLKNASAAPSLAQGKQSAASGLSRKKQRGSLPAPRTDNLVHQSFIRHNPSCSDRLPRRRPKHVLSICPGHPPTIQYIPAAGKLKQIPPQETAGPDKKRQDSTWFCRILPLFAICLWKKCSASLRISLNSVPQALPVNEASPH